MPDIAIDPAAARTFLSVAYQPADWVALFLKSYGTLQVAQRVGPISWAAGPGCQSWLRAMNERGFNVYVSVNAIAAGRRGRTRDAIAEVRHVFLEADRDAEGVLASARARRDLPALSYVIHSSPGRVHLFWRAEGFEHHYVERLQKQLARELATDLAATPITQTTRLPGFCNHKYAYPHLVSIEYYDTQQTRGPAMFPAVRTDPTPAPLATPSTPRNDRPASVRAKRYLASVPPAVAGEHGDIHTFRVCCRLVRGFALDDEQALALLLQWNEQCRPPWTSAELADKLRRAARYGREPVGGLL